MPGPSLSAPPTRRRHTLQTLTILCLLLVATACPIGGRAGAAQAFKPGERLVYRLRWTIVDAGEAELNVRPMATIDGRTVHHFALSVQSNAFIDAFYKVRDMVEAYADIDMNRWPIIKRRSARAAPSGM
jgi:hypothetical protein